MVLGPETRAVPYFAATMSLENALCAVDGNGELIGVAGFKTGDTGFLNGGTADIARHYGWIGSLWRLPLLMLLERKEAPETLQMDGICVAEEARGAGVGSVLGGGPGGGGREGGGRLLHGVRLVARARVRGVRVLIRPPHSPSPVLSTHPFVALAARYR